jgi:hypothetical protein
VIVETLYAGAPEKTLLGEKIFRHGRERYPDGLGWERRRSGELTFSHFYRG